MMILTLTGYLPNWEINIEIKNEHLYRLSLILFNDFVNNKINPQNIDIYITEDLEIIFGIRKRKAQNINEALFYVFEAVDYLTKNKIYPIYSLHGGAIAISDSVWGCIAPSHTGKSTLIAELTNQGCTLISDDTIFFDDNFKVYPFPMPLRLRSLSILSNYANFEVLHSGLHPISQNQEWLIQIKQNNNLNDLVLKGIFVLKREIKCMTSIEKLSMAEAYKSIITNGKTTDHTSIHKLNVQAITLIKKIPIYYLTYSNLAESTKAILNLTKSLI